MQGNSHSHSSLPRPTKTSSSSQSNPSDQTAAPLSAQSNLNLIVSPLYYVLHRILLLPVNVRVTIYFFVVTIGSLVFDFVHAPVSYFSNKKHLINIIFVNSGWGWTFVLLCAFIILSSFVYCGGRLSAMRSHLMRLLVGSSWWFIMVSAFNLVNNVTGQCYPLGNFSHVTFITDCRAAGGMWLGFDISGHTFLLLLCNLWMFEECQVLRNWDHLAKLLNKVEVRRNSTSSATAQSSASASLPPCQTTVIPTQMQDLSPKEAVSTKKAFYRLSPMVKLFAVVIACLTLVYDLMLVITIIYYHDLPSKFTGMLFAYLAWFTSYRVWFPCVSKLSPGLPGDGPIRFVIHRSGYS